MKLDKKWYTIVYTTSNRWGTLVHYKHIKINKNKTFEDVLRKNNTDLGQVVLVFPGWQD